MKLSVIIPVLNEQPQLPEMLLHLKSVLSPIDEVVFVDGGSTDSSKQICTASGYKVVDSSRGRAVQMNLGAQHSRGDLLLFLHADTRLPHSLKALREAVGEKCIWGRFDVQIESKSKILVLVSWMMNLRSRLTGIATGDQAIFVSRELFWKVGGYPVQPLMEDIDLCRRLKQITPPRCLWSKVRTSGRRWEQRGIWRTIFLMWRLRWQHWRGASIEDTARAYR